MKHPNRTVVALALSAALALQTVGAEMTPGQVDFGKLPLSGSRSELVEVNIQGGLLSLAARLAQKDEPALAEILRGLQRVRVHVIGLDDDNRQEMERKITGIREALDAQGWERVVVARKDGEDVGVYLKTKGGESVLGLVVTVIKKNREAVLVNVVGDIKPENLAMLGERFDIEPLKRLEFSRRK